MHETSPKGRSRSARGDRKATQSGKGDLGLPLGDFRKIAALINQGVPFSKLARLQRLSRIPMPQLAAILRIPLRTLARRKAKGRLSFEESERLVRVFRLFDGAVHLFEGDVAAARRWLTSPAKALDEQIPLEVAKTEPGAREVEELIGRLEHGVFT